MHAGYEIIINNLIYFINYQSLMYFKTLMLLAILFLFKLNNNNL